MSELERVSADEAKTTAKRTIILILDDVRSMHNVGSAFRTADAFGITAIYLGGFTPQPPHRDIRKTALGAEETVDWQHFTTTKDAIEHALTEGYEPVAVEQVHGSILLSDYKWDSKKPIAIIMGNEVKGVSDEALSLATACIEIPQYGTKHSLNVAVSTGVVLWELCRVES